MPLVRPQLRCGCLRIVLFVFNAFVERVVMIVGTVVIRLSERVSDCHFSGGIFNNRYDMGCLEEPCHSNISYIVPMIKSLLVSRDFQS